MKFDDFTGRVQHKAKLATTDEAIAAIRATLETLAEHTAGDEVENLAAQLSEKKLAGFCVGNISCSVFHWLTFLTG